MADPFNPRILVLDDDPFLLKLMERHLTLFGLTSVVSHSSGMAALTTMDATPQGLDLIMLDLNMPEMDGIEFVRHLVERRFTGSLILISGENERMLQSAKVLVQAHHIKLLGQLHKPVDRDELKTLLSQWKTSGTSATHVTQKKYDASALSAAILKNELVNYYQPKVLLATGRMVGVETLVRWQHPEDGMVYPDQFIEVAESEGLIDDLTHWVLHEALQQTKEWHLMGLPLKVAVNVSMNNLATPAFADLVSRAVASAGLKPSDIVLEITESQLKADMRVPLEILTRLRLKRFRLSIDDFGTGYSSLVQLRDIPFEELKIDKSFVHGSHANATLGAIFDGNMRMARQLEMDVVAEGVEDRDDWNFLRGRQCDLAQGYFIARPMPVHQIPDWEKSWNQRILEESLTTKPIAT